MQCPKCETAELMVEIYDETTFHRCPACRGIWIETADLQRVMGEVEAPAATDTEQPQPMHGQRNDTGRCPHCQTADLVTLLPRNCPTIRVHDCPSGCGLWLDKAPLINLPYRDLQKQLRKVLATSPTAAD